MGGSSHGIPCPRMSVAPIEVSPAERTVGQLVADAIRLYGRHFWRGLLIAVPATAFTVGAAFVDGTIGIAYGVVVGSLALGLSHLWASVVATGGRNAPGRALVAGAVAFLPLAVSRVAVFEGIYFVALAWFAFFGLAVPSVLVEDRSLARRFGAASSSPEPTSCTPSGPWPRWRSSSSCRSSRSRWRSPHSGRRASRSQRCSRSSCCRRSSSWGRPFCIPTRRRG